MKTRLQVFDSKTQLRVLNEINGANKVCDRYEKLCLEEFSGHLVGVVMGIAYGGDVERIATTWGDRGDVWGYDTFEGHPKSLSKDIHSFEATCMDYWYAQFGMTELTIGYQQGVLDELGLKNAHLVKGLVNSRSCNDLQGIHYAFLDMDIIASMEAGYKAVKDKIVPGGYLLLHDIRNIDTLIPWYEKIQKDWEVVVDHESLTGVLRKPKHESSTTHK